VLWEHRDDEVAPPQVSLADGAVTLEAGDEQPLRAWVLYRDTGGTFELDRIVPVAQGDTIALEPGRWAITAAAKTEVESLGVVVER
jgi:hypothetical protein